MNISIHNKTEYANFLTAVTRIEQLILEDEGVPMSILISLCDKADYTYSITYTYFKFTTDKQN